MHWGGADGKRDAEKPWEGNQIKLEEEPQEVNSYSVEDGCEDDEETDDSSIDTNVNSPLQEYGLSPLTSSPRSEEAADDRGEHLFHLTGFS